MWVPERRTGAGGTTASVVAVIRHADAATKLAQQGVQVFTGDACDASVVAAACPRSWPDALIISTMGGAQDYLAHRTVIDEAEKAGITHDSGDVTGMRR